MAPVSDPDWMPWGEWGECSHECGNGIRRKIQECTSVDGEIKCLTENVAVEYCYNQESD